MASGQGARPKMPLTDAWLKALLTLATLLRWGTAAALFRVDHPAAARAEGAALPPQEVMRKVKGASPQGAIAPP